MEGGPRAPGPTAPAKPDEVHRALVDRAEVAILDVRPEPLFAQGHPLFAASLPFDRLELEALDRVPRFGAPIVVYDQGEGTAERAARRLRGLGYRLVRVLEGGLSAWAAAGYELFKDVNTPSKAFGELVAERCRTPLLSAPELWDLIGAGADLAVVDARRADEFMTMSIPTARSAPGGELVLRSGCIAPTPQTMVVVNCAGRTRSIIGAQSLINTRSADRVVALENGTIGWSLAGLPLTTGATEAVPRPGEAATDVVAAARSLADRCGVVRVTAANMESLVRSGERTCYRFDVRSGPEYEAAHPSGFRWAPGGQLVQETDVYAPVRGALIVLADDDGVRANMAASWLAQMGWDVAVVDDPFDRLALEPGPWSPTLPEPPAVPHITMRQLVDLATAPTTLVCEVGPLSGFVAGHIEGSRWALRSDLALATRLPAFADARHLVLVSDDDRLARFVAVTVDSTWPGTTCVLDGGKQAWRSRGGDLKGGPGPKLSTGEDVYRRPYEGTDRSQASTRAYIEWELGLVDQLDRDSTHGFWVLT